MKKLFGIGIAVIICGLLINFFTSCEKNDIESYNLTIKNEYFEAIDSVYIDNVFFGKIETGEISQSMLTAKGTHVFKAKSLSGLKFSAKLQLDGEKDNIRFIFTNQGKLTY